MPYLLKSEPGKYSFDDLLRDGETVWDGIKNPQALITLRNMTKGEMCVIYHSNVGKAAIGLAKVLSVAIDPADGKTPIVRLKAGKRLKREKPLAEIREAGVFQGSLLFPPVPALRRAAHQRAIRLAPPRLTPAPGPAQRTGFYKNLTHSRLHWFRGACPQSCLGLDLPAGAR